MFCIAKEILSAVACLSPTLLAVAMMVSIKAQKVERKTCINFQ